MRSRSVSSCYLCLSHAGLIKVSFPFDAVTHAQLRKIKPRGIWCGRNEGWQFPLSAAQSLEDCLGNRFQIKEDLAKWLKWLKDPLPAFPSQYELLAGSDLQTTLFDGRTPLPHQCGGARWLMRRRAALLADEMGLGKTLTVLLAARAMVRCVDMTVMVIAPVGLHSHWLNEASSVGVEIDLQSWACLPKNLDPSGTLLVVDEAHFAQSLHSQRTQSLLRLARHPRLRAIWLITGTPMKNGRPIELFPLLAAMDHPLAQDRRFYEKHFCKGDWQRSETRRIGDCRGASNLKELKMLVSSLILNRRKDDCFGFLPPKYREEHSINLSKSEALGFNHRLNLVLDEYRYRVQQGLVQSEAESLVVISALRQISAEFKLKTVSTFIHELLQKGNAVVLFSSFVRPLNLLHNHLGGALLTGQQSTRQREFAVESFQKGETNLILATYGTGSLGYTLHRARNVVLLERPWTPGDLLQAEDRCHRLGMQGPMTSHWFKLGPIDNLVDSILSNKDQDINLFMQGKFEFHPHNSFLKMIQSFLQES